MKNKSNITETKDGLVEKSSGRKIKSPLERFPDTPPRGDMTRKHRMDRLEKKLVDEGFYVKPVCWDEQCTQWGYFIVSIDNPWLWKNHPTNRSAPAIKNPRLPATKSCFIC